MLNTTLKSFKSCLLPFSFLLLLACSEAEPGPAGADGINGVDGQNGYNALVSVENEAAGENCQAGGVKISVGQDIDGNGTLEESEILSVSFICNGADGANGTDGTDGANGSDGADGLQIVARTSPISPGAVCASGGTLVEMGLDANSNGVLDETEVQYAFNVCNGIAGQDGADGQDGTNGQDGQDGADGQDGLTSLIRTTALTNCGGRGVTGMRIEIGLDTNGNNQLDSNPNEVQYTFEICDGKDGADGADGQNGTDGQDGINALISCTALPPRSTECPNGGISIEIGMDVDRSGDLDASEIVGEPKFICNGADGQDGQDGRSPIASTTTDVSCPNGGMQITFGYDNDGDNIIDESIGSITVCNGADGADGADGANGLNSIIETSPSTTCINGGTFIEVGIDDNSDGILQPIEVDSSFDVCDGADGTNGTDGADGTSIAISVTSASCAGAGGWTFTVGIDTDDDNIPDANLNSYTICNGRDGADGADGNSDGIFEFYFTSGFDDYNTNGTDMLDATISQSPDFTNTDGESLNVGANASRQLSVSLLYFGGLDKIASTVQDQFYVAEAILYLRGSVREAPAPDSWVGVKALVPTLGLFDEKSVRWDGAFWTDGKSFSAADTEDFSDLFQIPSSFVFSGNIPLLLDRSTVTNWIKISDSNKGLAIEPANSNTLDLSIYSSENKTDPYYAPMLYIKVKIGKPPGGRESIESYKEWWNSLSYEEKLAPLYRRLGN